MGQVIVDNIDLLEPNLRIPGKKPVGQVKINPGVGIQKEGCILFASGVLSNTGFRDLTGKTGVSVSSNYVSPPYQHWFPHPLGVENYYGGDYTLANRIDLHDISFSDSDMAGGNVVAFGATFTLADKPLSGSLYYYQLVGDNNNSVDGKVNGSYNGLYFAGDTTLQIKGCATNTSITVPNMRDSKSHSAIGLVWNDGTNVNVQLILDGVVYTTVSTVKALFSYPLISAFAAASWANRVLDGVIHMVWMAKNPALQDCIEETKDPYQFLIPQ